MEHIQTGYIMKMGTDLSSPGAIEKILADASMHHRHGNLSQARTLFEKVLERRPDWPPLLNALGSVIHDMGDHEAAMDCFRQASASVPYPPAIYNMARLCHVTGDAAGAIRYYEEAVKADPDMAMAWNNLGLLLREEGDASRAAECFEKALENAPDAVEAWNNLALALEDAGHAARAADALRKAVYLQPEHVPALYNLGALEIKLGNRENASRLLEKVLEIEEDNQSARYLLQGLGRLPAPDAAPLEHVRKVFDECAEKFEKTLMEKLEYQTPAALFRLVEPWLRRGMSILDLGCGTGLGAELYRPFARMLAGIDASEGMLKQAGAKGVYDSLFCKDILASWDIRMDFDLVYSSDVFVYFGRLDSVLEEIKQHLAPGGITAFSVELLHDPNASFMLHGNGRFAHSRPYVKKQLEKCGFNMLKTEETVLRKEGGEDVTGMLTVAGKR